MFFMVELIKDAVVMYFFFGPWTRGLFIQLFYLSSHCLCRWSAVPFKPRQSNRKITIKICKSICGARRVIRLMDSHYRGPGGESKQAGECPELYSHSFIVWHLCWGFILTNLCCLFVLLYPGGLSTTYMGSKWSSTKCQIPVKFVCRLQYYTLCNSPVLTLCSSGVKIHNVLLMLFT